MIRKVFEDKEVRELRHLLERSNHIVLTCHVRPDGDAMGSTLGLYHLLYSFGKDVKVLTPDQPPRQLSFMPGMHDVVAYTKYEDYARRLVKDAELIICCDFNRLSRQEGLGELIEGSEVPKVMIDHHLYPDSFAALTFCYPEMSSASEVAFRLIAAMGFYTALNLNGAICLCTGIITDTKNLSVNCNDPEIYLIMLELMKKGVDKEWIVKQAMRTKTLSGIKLHAYALLNNFKIYESHKAALVWLNASELEKFGYQKGDTEGLVDAAGEAFGVVYSIFLREDTDCIKISTRSVDSFPVNDICERYFNGGGHLQAAGGKFFGTMDECIKLCEKIMPEYDALLPGNTH